MLRYKSILFLVPLLLATLLLSACEDTVNPILESDRKFTLFGTLDMNRDTQFVRVIPIRPNLDPTLSPALEINFTSQDVVSGDVITWQDSMITFNNGTTGLVFYAPFRVRPGRTYRIEVTTPGSEIVTSAQTTLPEAPRDIVVGPENITPGVGGAIGTGTQRIEWKGITEEPFQIDLWYRFLQAESAPFVDVRLPYEPDNELTATGWVVDMDYRRDRRTLDTLVAAESIALAGIGIQFTLLDGAFVPPGGVFDPEVLAQPGTFSNVRNGFGFIGSVGRFSVEWMLSDVNTRGLRMVTVEDLFGKRREEVLAGISPSPLVHFYPPRE